MKRELTPREVRIVDMLCGDCMSAKVVADKLKISLKTVETHRSNIMRKLHVHSAAELCRFYWRSRAKA